MTAGAIIDRARSLGIVLEAAGPRLRYDAPNGLPSDLRAELVEHKAEVLRALSAPDLTSPSASVVDATTATAQEQRENSDGPAPTSRMPTPSAEAADRAIARSEPPPGSYSRPPELAGWPLSRREAWGRRSEELELAGVAWPESERRAFGEVKSRTNPGASMAQEQAENSEPRPGPASSPAPDALMS